MFPDSMTKDIYILIITTGCPGKKFLLGFDLYIKENIKFSSSIIMDFFLSISGIILNTEPFLADI